MVDRETAQALGLNIEWATPGKSYGTFSGVNPEATQYAGRAVGPIQIRFSKDVCLELDELKVFDYPDSIILIGTDLLGHAAKAPYTFAYIGVNPTSTVGEIIFFNQKTQKYIVCELVHAPTSHTNKHVLPGGSKKKVSFAALSISQGQCL